MQLRLPWGREPASPAATGHTVTIDGEILSVEIARHRRARRYVLRVTPDGRLRMTVPRGASISGGLRFVERQADWIVRERVRQSTRTGAWQDGQEIWWRGTVVAIRADSSHVVLGADRVPVDGRRGALRETVEAWARAEATRELSVRCQALAAEHGIDISNVLIRNQRSRWGACSARGVITLNWRLLQMPAAVSDYVILHELAHRRQANHSRRFWREVERLCPEWRAAERWLRRHGLEIL